MRALVSGAVGFLLSVSSSQAFSASCASAKAAGSGTCGNFTGTIDVSQCGGETFSEPTVTCSGETATVKVKSATTVYTAQFILGQLRYGDRKWQLANPVVASQNTDGESVAKNKNRGSDTPKASLRSKPMPAPIFVKAPVPTLGTAASGTPIMLAQTQTSQPAASGSVAADTGPEKSFHFDYDVSASVNDNKFDMAKGADAPDSTTSFGQTAYLGFNGEADDVRFTVYANLMSSGPGILGALEVATASKEFGKWFALSVGRNYLNVGGWENKNWIFSSIFVSPYVESYLPFSDMNNGTSATMMQGDLRMGKAGTLSLQVSDDVVVGEDEDSWQYFNTAARQPVAIAEWTASFGPVTPLVQFSSYDLNHSSHASIGAKIEVAGLKAFLDYTTDSRATRSAEGKEEKYVFSNIAADLAYETRVVTPFLKFTTFDVKQPGTDLNANTDSASFDDNATIWTLGTNFNTVSPYFAPYIAYLSRSAEVFTDVTTSVEEKETRTGSSIIFGFGGTI